MDDKPQFQHLQSQSMAPAYGQVNSPTMDIADLQAQVQQLKQDISDLKAKRVNLNTDIIGLFETVTAAPTLTPTSPYDQIKLAVIAGTYYIYAYNTSSKTWKRVAIS